MQQGRTSTGDAARLVAVLCSVVVFEHVLDLQKGVPTHIGRVLVVEPDLPLLYWEGLLDRLGRICITAHRARAAVDERPSIRWVFEHRKDRRDRRLLPLQVAEAITARNLQLVCVEILEHLAGRADTEEGLEDEIEAMLHGLIWGFLDPAERIARQPNESRAGEFTACGLVEQAGRQTRADGMPLHLGQRAL